MQKDEYLKLHGIFLQLDNYFQEKNPEYVDKRKENIHMIAYETLGIPIVAVRSSKDELKEAIYLLAFGILESIGEKPIIVKLKKT